MKPSLLLIPTVVFLTFFSCVNDYNPFENKDNIDIKVEADQSSIQPDDSVSIFSTESLTIYPTLYEKIDSFTVYSEGNRLWHEPLQIKRSPKPGNYRYYFSWNDTGNTSIILTVYRSDGENFSRSYNLYRYSPLAQDSIVCEVGSLCTLSTAPIRDPGIMYHWYFGEFYGRKIEREFVSAGPRAAEIIIGQVSGTGHLWVEDTNGTQSPEVPFHYHFTDNSGPTITAVSGKINSPGDTIATGDSIFALRLLIMDNSGIRNVTFNGSTYDDREITANGEIVTKILSNMNSFSKNHPRADTIVASDASGLKSSKILYTYFSQDAPRTHAVILRLLSPSTDMWKTIDSSFSIAYRIINFSSDTIYTGASCADTFFSETDIVLPGTDKTVTWNCPLLPGLNKINVAAFCQDTITKETLIIERTKDTDDTIPPLISNILINGKDGVKHIIESDKAVLSFLAFDNAGKLDYVSVNDKKISETKGLKFQYYDTVQVSHTGLTVVISAVDLKGQSKKDTVYIKKNSAPYFMGSVSRRYIVGQSHSDTLLIKDLDGDSVSLSLSFTPQNQAVSRMFSVEKLSAEKAIIIWSDMKNPPLGEYYMTISLWDGYQSVNIQSPLFITNSGEVEYPAYRLIHKFTAADTLSDGTIDLRSQQTPVQIQLNIVNNLKELTSNDSIIIENAGAVSISNNRNDISIILKPDPLREPDTVNILVRSSDGTIDTAGRIPVLYSLRYPSKIKDQQYWFALDSFPSADATVQGTNALEWWNNRVSGNKELYSYTTGKEALFDNILTPGAIPSLRFGPRSVVLIRNIDGDLQQGADWPTSPFTAFFVVKRESKAGTSGGALWSSSDYDNVYFALGVSNNGKLAILNRPSGESGSVYESNVAVDTSWHVFMFRSQGCNEACSENLISLGINDSFSDSVKTPASGISYTMMIGCANKHNGNIPWPGRIAEVVCYNRVLSDTECREVSSYLNLKHKLQK